MTKLTADLAVITKLPDSPTETAAALKAKFDQAPKAIGAYLNDTLLPEMEQAVASLRASIENIEPVAVVDALDSDSATAALSAKAGGELAGQIEDCGQQIQACDKRCDALANALAVQDGKVTALQGAVAAVQASIPSGTSLPSTGKDGDLFILY